MSEFMVHCVGMGGEVVGNVSIETKECHFPLSFCLAERWMKESQNPHTSIRHDQMGRRKRRRKRAPVSPLLPLALPPL